jgi:hypothetical protein
MGAAPRARSRQRKDTTALIFYLKTHRPEIYADRRGPSTVVLNRQQTNVGALNTDSFSDEQLSKAQEFFRRLRERSSGFRTGQKAATVADLSWIRPESCGEIALA